MFLAVRELTNDLDNPTTPTTPPTMFRSRRRRRPEELRRLTPESDFVARLELERQRTERSGRVFCLLHIGENAGDDLLAPVAKRIHGRALRGTDCAGWFRDGLGVLLPETEAEGARKVADELLDGLPLSCRIYVFPSQSPPELEHAAQSAKPGDVDRGEAESGDVEPLEVLMTLHTPRWKRALDILGATAGLVVLSPLLAATAVAIRCTSQGPILFTQTRAGQGGRPFQIYKFRTMYVGAEADQAKLRAQSEQDGPAFKLRNDPRITWIGRYLRKSAIDELPQLWNVLVGDMSIVGPRPLPVRESAQVLSWHRRRLLVKPGLTCIWQAKGRGQGEEVKFQDWMRMDIRYIKRRRLFGDLGLILRTACNVLLHRASH